MYLDGITKAIGDLIVFMFFVGIGVGILIIWGLPHLWHFLKPLIHAWTA